MFCRDCRLFEGVSTERITEVFTAETRRRERLGSRLTPKATMRDFRILFELLMLEEFIVRKRASLTEERLAKLERRRKSKIQNSLDTTTGGLSDPRLRRRTSFGVEREAGSGQVGFA